MGGSGEEGHLEPAMAPLLCAASDFHIDDEHETLAMVWASAAKRPRGCDRCKSVTWERLGWYRAMPYRRGRERPVAMRGGRGRVPAQVL